MGEVKPHTAPLTRRWGAREKHEAYVDVLSLQAHLHLQARAAAALRPTLWKRLQAWAMQFHAWLFPS